MDSATEIVFVGTSAGGVGVANHVQWVREQISKDTSLLVIMDSSWFINFQGQTVIVYRGQPLYMEIPVFCKLVVHLRWEIGCCVLSGWSDTE